MSLLWFYLTRSPPVVIVGRPYHLYPKASIQLLVMEGRVTAVPFTPWWCCYIECYSQYYDTIW